MMRDFTAEMFDRQRLVYAQLASYGYFVPGFSRGSLPGLAERFYNAVETRDLFVSGDDLKSATKDIGISRNLKQRLVAYLEKTVGVGNVGASRIVSLSTEVTKIYNPDTVFLNLVEPNRRNTVTDIDHKWREDDINQADHFNPDQPPAASDAPQLRRGNTLDFIGVRVEVGLIAAELVRKRGFADEIGRQITDSLVAINRKKNAVYLAEIEDSTGPVFKLGGVLPRITDTRHIRSLSGSPPPNVSQDDLNALIRVIFEDAGSRALAIVCRPRQAEVIHGFLSAAYGGLTPLHFQSFYGQNLRPFVSTIFYSPIAGAIPVYADPQVPPGQGLIFDPMFVIPNGLTLNGVPGPFVIALAATGLAEPRAVFDAVTLEDRFLASRAKWVGSAD